VAVLDGHIMTISVDFATSPPPQEVVAALAGFRGRPQELNLPSAPNPPIIVAAEPERPQPRLDADRGNGMAITVGRVRPCKVTHTKFVALGHNTVRGAAGAAILNAELMVAEGVLD
jgi:aspartate-semialdehyde dehydrogenase